MKIANSMTITRMTGNETDFSTNAMIMKIRIMETAFTVLKSVFVMVLLSISSVEKVDSPIGDENYPHENINSRHHLSKKPLAPSGINSDRNPEVHAQ